MRKITIALFGICLILAMAPGSALAERDTVSAKSRLITVDYVNAEVTDVIRALAAQSGSNIALSPDIKGQVTIHLREKPLDEALQMVANMAGLGAKKMNDTYVIAPRAMMRATLERLGTPKTIILVNMSPPAAVDLVQNAYADVSAKVQGSSVILFGATEDLDSAINLIHQNDILNVDQVHTIEKIALISIPSAQAAIAIAKIVPGISVEPAGQALVVSGTKSQVVSARQALTMIDVPGPIDLDFRIYNIRYASASQLVNMLTQALPQITAITGPDSNTPPKPGLSSIGSAGSSSSSGNSPSGPSGSSSNSGSSSGPSTGGASSPTPVNAGAGTGAVINPNALSLVLKGQPAQLEQAFKLLALTDVPPQQMVIETKVVETSPEFTKNLGVQWSWNSFTFGERPNLSGGNAPPSTPGPMGGINFGSFGRAQASISATVNAMVTNKTAKLLANPSITVLNDQDASVFIGDTLRYKVQTSGINGPNISVFEVPVGIILLVHPRINDDGQVTLRVHPQVSTATIVGDLPQTHTREAETVVRVKDGDTLVIGGLIRDEDTILMRKVPFLGDLPLVGQLFRNEDRSHTRTEVMVFLTIHLSKS